MALTDLSKPPCHRMRKTPTRIMRTIPLKPFIKSLFIRPSDESPPTRNPLTASSSYHINPAPAPQGQFQPAHPSSPGQPKQEFYHQQSPAPQQLNSQQQVPQIQHQSSQYQTSVPVHSLSQGAAPVDCPSCRQRHLTRVEYVTGNTVLSVIPLVLIHPHRHSCILMTPLVVGPPRRAASSASDVSPS